MPGFGFGLSRSHRGKTAGAVVPSVIRQDFGALSRAQSGAGIATTATAILSGDPDGHWQISGGRLFPSTAGDTANLSRGSYQLTLNNGVTMAIFIESNTWDVATQAEWDFVSMQSAAILAGKKIALRNDTVLDLKITGATGTALRRVDLRAGGVPLTIEGRFGAVGDWAAYCEITRVQDLRGTRGVTFRHLKTTDVAEQKFRITGETASNAEDITITDCWVRGQTGDPNGNYSISSNYPNNNIDLIATTGSAAASVGNLTVTNNRVEWAGSGINLIVNKTGHAANVSGNLVQYFYDDAIAISTNTGSPCTVVCSDNFIINPMGRATDSAAPHVDALRLVGTAAFTADWTNITLERNIVLQGIARGDMQGIFLDDMKTNATDSGRFFSATIRHNIVAINTAVNALLVGQAKNCVIENNTIVAYNQAAPASTTPSLGVAPNGMATATSGGGNIVQNNIADSVNAPGATLANNFVTGRNGSTIAYLDLFDGPIFAPTSIAGAASAFKSKIAAGAKIVT